MSELMPMLQQITFGATGVWTGVAMFAAWWIREHRETRKMSHEDRLARRDGYAKQVELLMTENRNLGHDLTALRAEYNEYRRLCHAETDQLRTMVINAENLMAGLNRKVDDQSIRIAQLLGKGDLT